MATYLRWEATILKKSEQIGVLAVNISTNFDRSPKFQKHGLLHENFSGIVAKTGGVLHRKIHRRTGFSVPSLQELVDHSIDPIIIF